MDAEVKKINEELKKQNPFWWDHVIEWWNKKFHTSLTEYDPEFDAQKMYRSWLDSFK